MTIRNSQLDIQGMSCANCSTTVSEALLALDGVNEATVNFATDEGTVAYDPDVVSLAEIYHAIEEAGYHAISESVTIGITDMTCANCADKRRRTRGHSGRYPGRGELRD